MSVLANSNYWNKKLYNERGYAVIDPDGWDRKRFPESWDELITWEEFIKRVTFSTIGPLPDRIQK
jgi:hypothetical protein